MSDGFEIFFEGPPALEVDGRDRFLALRMSLGFEFEMLAIDCVTDEETLFVVIDEIRVDDMASVSWSGDVKRSVSESVSLILPVSASGKGSTIIA